MRTLAWAALGLAAGAVAFWPAASLEGLAQRQLPAGSTVALTGTLWKGTGWVQTGGASWPLQWRLAPSRVVAGRLAWQLEARPTGARAAAEVSLGLGGWAVKGPRFDGEIRALHTWWPALRLLGVQGRARLDAEGMDLRPATPWRATGDARLTLSELSVAAIGGAVLGIHEFSLKGSGESLSFEVLKSEGTLKLEGRGRIANDGDYATQGSALPLASFDAESRARLARFASPQPDGRYRWDVRGKW